MADRFAIDIAEMPRIKQFVGGFLAKLEKNAHFNTRFSLVIEELAMNIMQHSKAVEPYFEVEVTGKKDGAVSICFLDSGIPFNPTQIVEPELNTPLEQRDPGGLGLFLVKKYAEDIVYTRQDGRNKLYLEMQ